MTMDKKLSYEKSGVSIADGDAWVETIKGLISSSNKDPNIVGGVGGFSGLYRIGGGRCLAACCDGVGTKLEIAKAAGKYRGLGQDLVAMSVNDLVTCGASPLFFLDYIACGKLHEDILSEIVAGVIDACSDSLCTLLGGETAEMPGVYGADGFDLAGFAVGIVDEDKIIDGKGIKEGDTIIGIESSGIHSNGYSLVRTALLDGENALPLGSQPEGLNERLADALLRPTKLYVKAALAAIATGKVRGMANITGGGLEGNIRRIIPEGLKIEVDYSTWERPAVFDIISGSGVEEPEMRNVFNLGIGYVFVAGEDDFAQISDALAEQGERAIKIGRVIR